MFKLKGSLIYWKRNPAWIQAGLKKIIERF